MIIHDFFGQNTGIISPLVVQKMYFGKPDRQFRYIHECTVSSVSSWIAWNSLGFTADELYMWTKTSRSHIVWKSPSICSSSPVVA